MEKARIKTDRRERRHRRIRARVTGTALRPRLSVYKSNTALYAQLIDDEKGVTIATASSLGVKKGTMMEKAKTVGVEIAKAAKGKKIEKAVFDRGGFIYTGQIKALAESAREGGLSF